MGSRRLCLLLACFTLAWPEAGALRLRAQTPTTSGRNQGELVESPESYAVYSAILANPPLSHRDKNTKYAIAENILSKDELQTPKTACSGIPEVSTEALAQIFSDFENHKYPPAHLKRSLSLSKPYILLSAQQAEEFERWRVAPQIQTDPPSLPTVDPFAGADDLFRLSDVFFDHSKNVVMVYVSAWCGSLCGLSGWHVLHKISSNHWQELSKARCGETIS